MWTTNYLSSQTETDDFDLFPPFAKRSKEVTRSNEESVLPVQPQYDETSWKTAVPISCEDLFTYEPFLASALYSSSPFGMVNRHKRVSTSLTHENLPHPSQLMCRMRRYHRRQKHTPSVLQHIGELRMKQRHINELKGEKWWGATAVPRPEDSSGSLPEGGDEQLIGPAAGVSFSAMLMDNPDVTMTMPYEAVPSPTLLFSEYEQFHDLAPGGNPMMSFVSGTAHRSLLMADNVCATVNSGTSDRILGSNDDMMSLFY
ncbi:uncharacterized protein LOC113094299 [Carassius auratus]|uniref:Uncharacterized protein LOC113094299 n=1 Tax=Carassius auratus TaxID=7957 RepID=A0A6P6P547_CARAU|nr:uncharacterized protein LOC113094299 [Carassius auratus]